jgi:hypothetical protein
MQRMLYFSLDSCKEQKFNKINLFFCFLFDFSSNIECVYSCLCYITFKILIFVHAFRINYHTNTPKFQTVTRPAEGRAFFADYSNGYQNDLETQAQICFLQHYYNIILSLSTDLRNSFNRLCSQCRKLI